MRANITRVGSNRSWSVRRIRVESRITRIGVPRFLNVYGYAYKSSHPNHSMPEDKKRRDVEKEEYYYEGEEIEEEEWEDFDEWDEDFDEEEEEEW